MQNFRVLSNDLQLATKCNPAIRITVRLLLYMYYLIYHTLFQLKVTI